MRIANFAAALATLLLPTMAQADEAYFDLFIPASACRPIHEDISKVKLSDGAWVFESGQSGTVTLFCPVHIAKPFDLLDSSAMGQMLLWYVDPSGTGSNSSVTAQLMRRKYDASTDSTVGSSIASNGFSDTTFAIYATWLSHTANFDDYSYHVEITMVRSSSTVTTPEFIGLDWEPPPSEP